MREMKEAEAHAPRRFQVEIFECVARLVVEVTKWLKDEN
jgi:hypothetical protein